MTMISEWLHEEAPDANELAEVSFIVRALRGQYHMPARATPIEDVPSEVLERSVDPD